MICTTSELRAACRVGPSKRPPTVLPVILAAAFLGTLLPRDARAGSFSEGMAAWRRGDLPAAAASFQAALALGDAPPEWSTWYLAQVEVARGESRVARFRLEPLARHASGALRYRATDLIARTLAAEGQHYAATRWLLDLAEDTQLGPRARFRAGEILLAAGDTPAALRTWSALCTRYPDAPAAHRAVLRILDLSGPVPPVGDYELLLLARSAAAAEDFTTADVLLESTVQRRMDRRIRDDLLRLHGDVLLRMSQYDRALETYREARTLTLDPVLLDRIDRRILLCRLHRGETSPIFSSRRRALRAEGDPEFLAAFQAVAALRRLAGDNRLSRAITELTGAYTFEAFLAAWEDAGGWNGVSTSSPDAWKAAVQASDGLTDPEERAIALALLARQDPRRAVDWWRGVLYATDDPWLAARAREGILAADSAGASWTTEADQLLGVALRALQAGKPGEALRHLRVCRFGYPKTPAAETAHDLARQIVEPWFRNADLPDPRLEEARALLAAGAPDAAALVIEEDPRPEARIVRLFALHASDQTAELVRATRSWQASLPARLLPDELPDSVAALLHPLWAGSTFTRYQPRSASTQPSPRPTARGARPGGASDPVSIRTPGRDSALLHALAFASSGLDRFHQSGYRLGLMGIDAEATVYAREIPGAPRLDAIDLLDPDSAVAFASWLLDDLASQLGESAPHRLGAAWLAGPAFLAPPAGASPLVTLARLPFPRARKQFLTFLAAYDDYAAKLPATRHVTSAPNTPASRRPGAVSPTPPSAPSARSGPPPRPGSNPPRPDRRPVAAAPTPLVPSARLIEPQNALSTRNRHHPTARPDTPSHTTSP